MKRFLGIVLVFVFLATPVLAESDDLSAKSTEELLTLKDSIDRELGTRLGTIGHIYSGRYVVGKDIKPGRYVLFSEEAVGDWKIYAQIYREESDKVILEEKYISEGETYAFSLNDGETLFLKDVELAYLQMLDKPVWAP